MGARPWRFPARRRSVPGRQGLPEGAEAVAHRGRIRRSGRAPEIRLPVAQGGRRLAEPRVQQAAVA